MYTIVSAVDNLVPVGKSPDMRHSGSGRDARANPARNLTHEDDTLDTAHAMDRFLAGVERRAFHMARVATGNTDEALDIVQDAMLKLVQKYAGRDASDWGPLFHRILQSRITDWYRRSAVRNRFRVWFGGKHADGDDAGTDVGDFVQELADPSAMTPDREVGNAQAMQALEAGLRALPLRQQQAFLLRTLEGMSVADTAAAMGCSAGSVKTHYSRAVHKLRDQLAQHMGD